MASISFDSQPSPAGESIAAIGSVASRAIAACRATQRELDSLRAKPPAEASSRTEANLRKAVAIARKLKARLGASEQARERAEARVEELAQRVSELEAALEEASAGSMRAIERRLAGIGWEIGRSDSRRRRRAA